MTDKVGDARVCRRVWRVLLMFSLQPSLPPPSVYNEDYFANVEPSPGTSRKDTAARGAKDKKKKDDKRKSGTLRDLFVSKDKTSAPPEAGRGLVAKLQQRLSQGDIDVSGSIAPVPVAASTVTVSAGGGSKSSPRRQSPEDKGKKKPDAAAEKAARMTKSQGEVSHITKLVVKLESDRKTIQVGLAKTMGVERKYLGVSLVELSARDSRLVPAIVSDLTKWLWQRGTKEVGIFVLEATADRVQALVLRIEKGLYSSIYEETDVDTPLVTSVIKEFFRQLPDPLFSHRLYEDFVGARNESVVSLLLQLPPPHLAAVKTLLPFLFEVASEEGLQMSAADLAQVLGPVLLRPKDVTAAKGFPGVAVEAVAAMIAGWSGVAELLSRMERDAGAAEETESTEGGGEAGGGSKSIGEDGDHVDLFGFLDNLGMLHHFDVFKQVGITMAELRRMELPDLEELGVLPQEGEIVVAHARKLPLHGNNNNSNGVSHGGNNDQEGGDEVWEEGELDPRVRKFLVSLELDHLVELFNNCQIDWVILDMSAVSDFKELGLNDATIVKIMAGLGKDVAVPGNAVAGPIGINGNEMEMRSAVSDADVTLDPKWVLDLRAIRVQKKIGIGGYAEVWKALWKEKVVAFKLLQEDTTEDKRVVDEFRKEMAVMSQLDHPNIVAFFGAVDHGRSLAMVLEYAARGDLEGILLDHKTPIPYLQRLRWAKQVAQGLQYLHTRNPRVIHRDIKVQSFGVFLVVLFSHSPHQSANILVDELLCCKICDFGLAKRKTVAELPSEGKGMSIMQQNSRVMNVRSAAVQFTTLVGTPAWTAPELIANRSYTEKVDVYSFSVFLWELMCRQTPHEGMPHFELAYEILAHNLRPVIYDFIPETFKQLMKSCW